VAALTGRRTGVAESLFSAAAGIPAELSPGESRNRRHQPLAAVQLRELVDPHRADILDEKIGVEGG
jgi:hypothetical protein